MKSYEYSVAVLKRQGFQDKPHVESFASSVRRSVKAITFNALPETPEDM